MCPLIVVTGCEASMNALVATSLCQAASFSLLASSYDLRRQALDQRCQHSLDFEHHIFQLREILHWQEQQIFGEKHMVFHFVRRATCDLQEPPHFRIRPVPATFSDVRPSRDRGSSELTVRP